MSHDNVIAYLREQQQAIDLVNGNKINITKTKFEEILISFSDYNSKSNEFVNLVSSDDLLRTFFFLESKVDAETNRMYPSKMNVPIILDPEYDFQNMIESRQDMKKQLTDITDEHKKSKQELEDLNIGIIGQLFNKFIDDDAVISAFKKQRDSDQIKKVIENSFKKRENEFKDILAESNQIVEKDRRFKALETITQTINHAKYAMINSKTLKNCGVLPLHKDQLEDKLTKLASSSTINFLMEVLCLDCMFKFDHEPFISVAMNLEKISLLDTCPRCNGKGLVHQLVFVFPRGLHKVVLPETNWLHEVIIGYTLAQLPMIKKVYVHKKVSAIIEGVTKSGLQIDVIGITNDDKLVLIEVTSQSDLNNLMVECNNKIKNLKESQISYDLFIYVTSATQLERYIPLSDKDIMMGINHIYKIKDQISYLLTNPK